jgi:hypothetical protein
MQLVNMCISFRIDLFGVPMFAFLKTDIGRRIGGVEM